MMAATTRRISPSEWAAQKDRIVAVSQSTETLKDLMKSMEQIHGFCATIAQYENQFRLWSLRKNLKRHEWAHVLANLDGLQSQGKKYRVLISGNIVSPEKIQTARRRYRQESARLKRGGNQALPPAKLENVVVEIQDRHGTWATGNFDEEASHPDPGLLISEDLPTKSPVPIHGSEHTTIDAYRDSISSNNVMEQFFPSFEDDIVPTTNTILPDIVTLNSDMGTSADNPLPQLSGEWFQRPSNSTIVAAAQQQEALSLDAIWSNWPLEDLELTSGGSFQCYGSMVFASGRREPRHVLKNLLFDQFMDDLEAQGFNLNKRLSKSFTAVNNPVALFLTDVMCSSTRNGPAYIQEHEPERRAFVPSTIRQLRIMDTLKEHTTIQSPLPQEERLQHDFYHNLLRSVINGFAGLQGLPTQNVVKYLSKCEGMDSLLVQILQSRKSLVVKALAEKLFVAFIEKEDHNILRRLLATRLVDVNAAVCVVDGAKYTPIERAATLRHLEMMELFISVGADVNKTFALVSGGALKRLASHPGSHLHKQPKIASDHIKVLLQAGAKVSFVHISLFWNFSGDNESIYHLISSISEADHPQMMEKSMLSSIARRLDDKQATDVVQKMLLMCQKSGCGTCVNQFAQELDEALELGAQRGLLDFVHLLSSYSNVSRGAPNTKNRSDESGKLEMGITLSPDLDALAYEMDDNDGFGAFFREFTMAMDEISFHRKEDTNIPIHVAQLEMYKCALNTASESGNCIRVMQLLCFYRSFHGWIPLMDQALEIAIQNDNEEIFWLLLEAARKFKASHDLSQALFTAIVQRNTAMVVAILDANVSLICNGRYETEDGPSTISGEAVKWGNFAILQALRTASPDMGADGELLWHPLEGGNMEVFTFLIESKIANTTDLTGCLKIPLHRKDKAMVQYLIDSGADASDPEVLIMCVWKYPRMLNCLLRRLPQTRIPTVTDSVTAALQVAIWLHSTGFDAARDLIDSGLTDINTPSVDISSYRASSKYFDLAAEKIPVCSPLELAIEISQDGDHEDFFVLRKLFEAGYDANITLPSWRYRDSQGKFTRDGEQTSPWKTTAFMNGIESRDKALVQLMLDYKASANREANLGVSRTPLQKAVEVESLEIMRMLLDHGASVNEAPATWAGATALQLAAIQGNCEIAIFLLEQGADLHAPPARFHGRWPLEGAAEHGRFDMIELLWKVKTSMVGFEPAQCRKAMELAEGNGHIACKELVAEVSQQSEPNIDDWLTLDN